MEGGMQKTSYKPMLLVWCCKWLNLNHNRVFSHFSYGKEKFDLLWIVEMHFCVGFKVGLILTAILYVQQINFKNTRRKQVLSFLVNLFSMTRPLNVLPLGQIYSLQFSFSSPNDLSVIIWSCTIWIFFS